MASARLPLHDVSIADALGQRRLAIGHYAFTVAALESLTPMRHRRMDNAFDDPPAFCALLLLYHHPLLQLGARAPAIVPVTRAPFPTSAINVRASNTPLRARTQIW